ncbi:MAG: hypothetical protein RR689_01245 [Mucinivorans sp.]
MIVKMTRYGFLLYHGQVSEFLERLGDKGLVDITLSDTKPNEELSGEIARLTMLKNVARELKGVKKSDESLAPIVDVDQAVELYTQSTAKISECRGAISRAQATKQEVAVWGDFDPRAVDMLADRGVKLRFFETTVKAFSDQWAQDLPIEVVNRTKTDVYFVVVEQLNNPIDIHINALEVKAPASSATLKDEEIARLEAQITDAQRDIARCAIAREALLQEIQTLSENIDFEQVKIAGEDAADGTLKILEGWSPNEDRAAIVDFAESQGVVFTVEDAKIEQNPPIKLKNHFFARLYEPIGSLYLQPRYNELDMTPFFAPFFMIFFGMCLGDAGYGLLFIAVILAVWKKIPKKMKDFAWLGIFLCLAAVIFGILSGNVFGIELIKVDALVDFKEFFLDPNDVFYISIALGAVQVLFGQVLRIFNRAKRGGSFIYGLSSLGWVILFVSSLIAGFDLFGAAFSFQSIAYLIVAGLAGVLILFLNKPKKNPFVNLGAGLYSCYEMATGVVGDLISYVRLFAIGLAGTVIAQVFNELSKGLSGDIPVISFLIMVVILVIGHGLNIFISALGAFVHPVRLTFVEFYKNAEFEGGGRVFKPFKRKINNK